MKLSTKYLKENADPGCEACEGNGFVCRSKEEVRLGPGTMIVGDKSFRVENTVYNPVSHDPCPRCFDPKGKPRNGQRIKK